MWTDHPGNSDIWRETLSGTGHATLDSRFASYSVYFNVVKKE